LPASTFEKETSLCLIHGIFGIDCPGCGTFRAISSIFHFQLVNALNYNRSIIIIFPLLGYVWLKFIIVEIQSIFPCNPIVKKLRSLFALL
jgi:hypothetical protein